MTLYGKAAVEIKVPERTCVRKRTIKYGHRAFPGGESGGAKSLHFPLVSLYPVAGLLDLI